MNYWLIKSEGDCYHIDMLKKDGHTPWEGIRNFQARNFMKDMQVGDLALFYHSSALPSGVYGVARVTSLAHADHSALDKKGDHYDPRSTKEKPIWECVDFEFVKKLTRPVPLDQIKEDSHLEGMLVSKRGQRLSIMPVEKAHFERVVHLGDKMSS